jgi:hypothetical protein
MAPVLPGGAALVVMMALTRTRQIKTLQSGDCQYFAVESPNDNSYRERAWSESAADSPWKWPIAARNVIKPSSVVNRSHYQSIVDAAQPLENPCGGGRRKVDFAHFIDQAAGPAAAVAIGYLGYRHHSLKYGHVWDYINSFYCTIIQPRAIVRPSPLRHLRVFAPAGMVECSREHEHILTLFGSERAQRRLNLTLERAPWVPSCTRLAKECYAHGGPPRELRGRVTLLDSFPIGGFTLGSTEHRGFRNVVHDALGLGQGPPGTILYIRSSKWPTRRHVADEERVIEALAKWAAAEHPQLNFSAEHVHRLPFGEEVARFADARVMISLWGSSIHNCRYMRAGTLVVELFGALGGHFGDTVLYNDVCSRSCRLQHAPLGVPGAYPLMQNVGKSPATPTGWKSLGYPHPNDLNYARVDPEVLVAFMRRIFPADPCQIPDWVQVFEEFNAFLAKQPNPNTGKKMASVNKRLTDPAMLGPSAPQYVAPRAGCKFLAKLRQDLTAAVAR